MPKLTTSRLTIRMVAADDWPWIQKIWEDFFNSPYAMYDKPKDTRNVAVEQRIRRWADYADSIEHMFFAVCLQETMIGYIALNIRDTGYELGYCFHSRYHGMGYAKESIEAVCCYAKGLGAAAITAGTALANLPSVRLLEKLQFQLVETEKVSFYTDTEGRPIWFDGGIFKRIL